MVVINVMDGEYSFVSNFAETTYLWHFCTKKQCPVCIRSTFPIRVCFSYIYYWIAPECLARFVAKVFFTFWVSERLRGPVYPFTANKTPLHHPIPLSFPFTGHGTILPPSMLDPVRLCVKFGTALFAWHYRHIAQCILADQEGQHTGFGIYPQSIELPALLACLNLPPEGIEPPSRP